MFMKRKPGLARTCLGFRCPLWYVCFCKLNNTSYSSSIFHLTSKQINRSISTGTDLCSAHSEREECGFALSEPSLCYVMTQSELALNTIFRFLLCLWHGVVVGILIKMPLCLSQRLASQTNRFIPFIGIPKYIPPNSGCTPSVLSHLH